MPPPIYRKKRPDDVPTLPSVPNDGLVHTEFKGASRKDVEDFKAGYRKPRSVQQQEMDAMFERIFKSHKWQYKAAL